MAASHYLNLCGLSISLVFPGNVLGSPCKVVSFYTCPVAPHCESMAASIQPCYECKTFRKSKHDSQWSSNKLYFCKCNYLSILGLKLHHVSQRGYCCQRRQWPSSINSFAVAFRWVSAFVMTMFKLTVAKWHHDGSWNLVNIGSGNGLLPDSTEPLPDPMLKYYQRALWSSFKAQKALYFENYTCKPNPLSAGTMS